MKPFQFISEKEEYRDGNRFSVLRAHLITPEEKEVEWAYIKGGDGVIVVALDADNNVYVQREWRLNRKDFVWEFPSGGISPAIQNEIDIFAEANRELQEEAGIKGKNCKLLGSFYVMNHSTSKFHIVLMKDLEVSPLKKDEHEHLFLEKLSLEAAYQRLVLEQVPTAQVLIALELTRNYLEK